MSRKSIVAVLLMIGVFVVSGCRSAAVKYEKSKTPENLLLNSSFENTENMQNWSSEGNASFKWVQDWHHYNEGKSSFGVGNDAGEAEEDAWAVCCQVITDPGNSANLYSVKPGDLFTFEIWVKAEEDYKGSATIKLEYFKHDRRDGFGDGPIKSYRCKTEITSSRDWQKLSVKGKAPEGTVSVAVVCLSEKMSSSSKFVFFDEGCVAVK